jgi:hypothetical protein
MYSRQCNSNTSTIFVGDLQVLLNKIYTLHVSTCAYVIIRRYRHKIQVCYCESKCGSVFFYPVVKVYILNWSMNIIKNVKDIKIKYNNQV